MAVPLPADIIYIIIELLEQERDFNSLFQCAVTARCFVEQALTALYKSYELSPIRGGGTEISDSTHVRRKWALMWRSIVLSTLNQTCLPYYSYIRYLDLNDLSNLLSHSSFTGTIKENFFTPELQDLVSHGYEPKGNKRLRSLRNLPDNKWILSKFGSAIIQKTSSIRGMSCDIEPSLLAEWLKMLPLLQTLTIWSGISLIEHAGDTIREYCPDFRQIIIYRWINEQGRNSETDAQVFLSELQPHSLEYFEMLSSCHLGPRSIGALGTQLHSLVELKLTSLDIETIAELPSLTSPPVLKVLVLTDSIPAARSEYFYSTVTRVADWIRSCKSLRRLELRRFVDDPRLLSQVLNDESVRLQGLSLTGYTMAGSHDFHNALAYQQSLQNLHLRGEGSEIPADNESLIQSISQLVNLRDLELKDISDYFTPDHVKALAPCISHLERLWIGGDYFDDDIWVAFRCLPKLRSLVIHALSEFTAQGILDFIAELGADHRGMNLSILNSVSPGLTEEAQILIRDTMKGHLDGTFDFGLAQEEYSDADSEEMSD